MSATYVLRRVAQLLPAVLGIVMVGFLLVQLAPGDPVSVLAGDNGDADYYARMRARFGLDQPVPVQLLEYGRNVLTGNLGTSIVQGRPVSEVILSRLPATLLLTTSALLLSTMWGVALGIWAARRAGRLSDTAANATLLTVHAAPDFWLGQMVLLLFAGTLGWFPVHGMFAPASAATGLPRLLDLLHHMTLPVLVLAVSQVAIVTRLTRTSLTEELRALHVQTARAKGLTERRVVYVHALRRSLLAVATVIGGRVGHLLAGTVVIEVVFGWPGVGRLLLTAMQTRDHPLLMGLFLMVAFTVVIANLLTDLVYGWLDPRIQYER